MTDLGNEKQELELFYLRSELHTLKAELSRLSGGAGECHGKKCPFFQRAGQAVSQYHETTRKLKMIIDAAKSRRCQKQDKCIRNNTYCNELCKMVANEL